MISGAFQPPVSRLTVAMVDRHCGAITYQANNDSAVARLHWLAIIGVSNCAAASSVADNAYTVSSALTATSRAARPGTSAMEICQLKPIGSKTTANQRPT